VFFVAVFSPSTEIPSQFIILPFLNGDYKFHPSTCPVYSKLLDLILTEIDVMSLHMTRNKCLFDTLLFLTCSEYLPRDYFQTFNIYVLPYRHVSHKDIKQREEVFSCILTVYGLFIEKFTSTDTSGLPLRFVMAPFCSPNFYGIWLSAPSRQTQRIEKKTHFKGVHISICFTIGRPHIHQLEDSIITASWTGNTDHGARPIRVFNTYLIS
jgi:hypothetical protein